MNTVVRWSVGIVVVASMLGACSPSADPDPTAPPTDGTQLPEVEASPEDDAHIDIGDQPGSLPDFEGALADSEVTSFERGSGEWVAEGTVTNPTDETVVYRIYASAMGDGGSSTRGVVQVDVEGVAAGESAPWSASFPLEDEVLTLVLRVERAPAAE